MLEDDVVALSVSREAQASSTGDAGENIARLSLSLSESLSHLLDYDETTEHVAPVTSPAAHISSQAGVTVLVADFPFSACHH